MEQDLIVSCLLSSTALPPLLDEASSSGSFQFYVSAESWEQIIQSTRLPNLMLKTSTTRDFTLSLHSLSWYSHHLQLGLCLLPPELVLVLVLPLDKNE